MGCIPSLRTKIFSRDMACRVRHQMITESFHQHSIFSDDVFSVLQYFSGEAHIQYDVCAEVKRQTLVPRMMLAWSSISFVGYYWGL